MINFQKMHGLGNDFVILDARNDAGLLNLDREFVRKISSRNRGVGCDQLIVIEFKQNPKSDIFMRIYNANGGEAGACGNATRCVAHIYGQENNTKEVVIETISGLLVCTINDDDTVTVDMGEPCLDWKDIPLSKNVDTVNLPLPYDASAVGMGNPHCIVFVEDADTVDVEKIGKELETHELFPENTNVEFVCLKDRQNIRMRVWERGSGITEACGSGACAVAVASIRRDLCEHKVNIHLDGGVLTIEWGKDDGHVLMTGPLTYVFEGTLSL